MNPEKKGIPSRELTCPTLGKGKSSSKVIFDGICSFPGGYPNRITLQQTSNHKALQQFF